MATLSSYSAAQTSPYAAFLASVVSWSHRTDLNSLMPDFIALAEARISRDLRIRQQITTTALTSVTGINTVALPIDWLELENLSVNTVPATNLIYVTVEQLDSRFPFGGVTGIPVCYTVEGGNLLLGPAPSSALTVNLIYYARFASLLDAGTNWLLQTHPSIYLFAVLMEVSQYTQNAEQLQIYTQRYQTEALQLQQQDDRATHSGSALRVRTI